MRISQFLLPGCPPTRDNALLVTAIEKRTRRCGRRHCSGRAILDHHAGLESYASCRSLDIGRSPGGQTANRSRSLVRPSGLVRRRNSSRSSMSRPPPTSSQSNVASHIRCSNTCTYGLGLVPAVSATGHTTRLGPSRSITWSMLEDCRTATRCPRPVNRPTSIERLSATPGDPMGLPGGARYWRVRLADSKANVACSPLFCSPRGA